MPHTVNLTATAKQWRIERKGTFVLRDSDGTPSGPLGRKARAILAYLSTKADEHVGRDRIVQLLWAERGEVQARGSLRQSLFETRRAAPDLIGSDHQHLWIERSRISCAEESETGELFADLNGITPQFDEWLRSERATESREQYSELEHQVEALLHKKKGSTALPLLERMAPLDPYNEDWLRLAMRAEALAGHPVGVQKRYSEFAESLRRDLSVAPAIETRELRDKLLHELTAERKSESRPGTQAAEVMQFASVAQHAPRRNPWLFVAGTAAMLASLGLTHSATNAAVPVPTVAVLPFEAVGIEQALADGFSDELLTQLVHNHRLRVIGRTAFVDVRSTPDGLKSFRRELSVEYIVEGRVASERDRLRVLVSLVRTKDAQTIWAERFVGSRDKLQSIQAAIGTAVGRSLDANGPPFALRTTNGEAYTLYLRARGLIRGRTIEGHKPAAELLNAAIRMDPKFAAAWAQLAANTKLTEDGATQAFADPTNPGAKLTPVQGAQRALDLDPNLAEAHATMALAQGLTTGSARAHLRKALAIEPRDPQTLSWAGIAAYYMGSFRLSNAFHRRSAALDPSLRWPVLLAAIVAVEDGDRTGAEDYLRTIKSGNPDGASWVEVGYRCAEGDFSAAGAIAIKDWVTRGSWDGGQFEAGQALVGIGLRSAPFGPTSGRALSFGRMPNRARLMSIANDWSGVGPNDQFYFLVLWGLAREQRWSDIEAFYDQDSSMLGRMANGDPGGRYLLISFGGITALALKKAGRDSEAVKVALATEEAVRFALANGKVPAEVLASIAQDEAVLGHRDAALAHLEKAYSMGWRMFLNTNRYMDPGDDPTFATLRHNSRFERIHRLIKAHKAKERREFLAFMNQPSLT